MPTERVEQLLNDLRLLDESRYQLIQTCRSLILGLHPDIKEEVKYGGVLFGVNQHFCGIFSYNNHVTIEFSHGATLKDTYQVLEGKGKYRRHIKLTSNKDIQEKHLLPYLEMALLQTQTR